MGFTITSYNILADAYLNPEWYARTPSSLLDPARRGPAVVARVAGLGADAICLQEVEEARFEALRRALEPLGFRGRLLLKTGRPDGCATFVRAPALSLRAERHIRF